MPLRPRIVDATVAVLAAACLVAGAVVIGVARVVLDRYLYISELGALTMPTAELFQVGFLLVVAGIVLVGVVVRDVRTRLPVLRRWAPAASLVTAGGLFLVAAAVPCSLGCPSLLTDGAQWRDWVHIAAAVLAFAAGCVAMLQFATAGDRWVARLSAVSGIAVGVIAATGGIISLARGNTDVGSTLEYVAAGMGVVWMLAMVVVHTVPARAGRPAAPADALVGAER
ncbi:DUF998 domain-containing protein [Agrococcus jenensis]|uniref:Uncharacterized protein DUF998 n=2 Tax=Bacteria TaxID=2 RepID=A0A3N2APT8_9MICO|nr:DUF998 domain-containing protein [Agrococcus jenensis]ROR65064.1 uncharacterized protein DUF998 [Agrococcus jenensis]